MTHGLCNYRTNAHTQYNYTVCAFSVARVFSLLEDGGVATKVNVCMSTCMCICTMLYLIVFHLFKLFTYPNKMFVAFDQWGSDNWGFTVVQLCTLTHSPAGLWPHCMNPTPRAPSGQKGRLLPQTSLGTGHWPHLEWLGAALGSSPLGPEDCRRAWGRAVSACTGRKGRWSIRCTYICVL